MQWVVTRFVRDSFASIHATVFNCLVGMPNAMISGEEDMCAWSWGWDERKCSGSYAALCCIPGGNAYRKYMSSMFNNLYGIIIILFHGIPGIENVYMCIRDAQQREICERLLNDTQWTPIEITTHSTHSILLCFMHVFICLCLCSAGSTRGGRGRKICYTVFFNTQPDSVYLCAEILLLLWLLGGLIGILRKFVGSYS